MKTKIFFLALSCFFFLSIMGYTQSTLEEKRQIRTDQIKSSLRKSWDGQPSYVRVIEHMHYPGLRVALEFSDEQYEQMRQAPARGREEWEKSPEYEELLSKIRPIYAREGYRMPEPGDIPPSSARFQGPMPPNIRDFSVESRKQLDNIASEMNELQNIAIDKAYAGILTPEQERKLHEVELANMSLFMLLSPMMFEGLDLTDAQREQMKTLTKDFETEFEKYCENFANYWITHDEILFSTLEKQKGETLAEQMQETRKILEENPEYKRIVDEWTSLKKSFAAQFMKKMHERTILTGEQWTHLQKLFDDPPGHAKMLISEIQAYRGLNKFRGDGGADNKGNEADKGGGADWQPGPGSWKPGDAIPEQYRQDRNDRNRFPRGAE